MTEIQLKPEKSNNVNHRQITFLLEDFPSLISEERESVSESHANAANYRETPSENKATQKEKPNLSKLLQNKGKTGPTQC